jgi:hypothetical protein
MSKKLRAYSVTKRGEDDFVKSAVVYGHLLERNASFPLMYLQKPKHITDEQFDKLVEGVKLTINADVLEG